MRYTFKDILDENMYSNTRVMFILGKYPWFNNMVIDTLKAHCTSNYGSIGAIGLDMGELVGSESVSISDEFGTSNKDDKGSGLIDFNTFMDVSNVANIHGKWFCKCDLNSLSKKQKEKLWKYIKEPSINGILVIECTEWTLYREVHKNRILGFSQYSHSIELDFPTRKELADIVKQSFDYRDLGITQEAVDIFLTKMNKSYSEYEEMIEQLQKRCNEQRETIKTLSRQISAKNCC